ncbi:MAG: FtsQ-type POTRA domain-containing protein [Ktedonobacteraceae bacterium]|nr:FtsQ-type POTRA domain-containing protein [Ktedonobacteraceae bacterium]
MTEKKELREQIASHTYRRQAASPVERPQSVQPVAYRRVVTTPHEIVRPAGWTAMAERRQRQRYTAHREPATPLVARRFSQMGTGSTSGRMQAVRPPAQRHNMTPIPRRSGRYQGRPKNLFWRVLGFIAIVAIVALGASFALNNSAFHVRQVSVVGTHNHTLIYQIQRMGMQGQNIFLVNTTAFTLLIGALPMVASARIEKQWPDGLKISVLERTARLLWQTKQGVYGVDNTGMVMAPVSDLNGADHLQTVVDRRTQNVAGQKSLLPGFRLNTADVQFAETIFDVLPRITSVKAFTLIYESTLYVDTATGRGRPSEGNATYVVASPDGWVAYLGNSADPNPLENRLVELQQILVLTQKQQLHLATIDLRFGLRPVYTLKN